MPINLKSSVRDPTGFMWCFFNFEGFRDAPPRSVLVAPGGVLKIKRGLVSMRKSGRAGQTQDAFCYMTVDLKVNTTEGISLKL